MQRRLRILLFTFLATVFARPGEERILGTWKLNTSKSKFNPGPPPKVLTQVYSQEGEWIVVQYHGLNAEGKEFKTTNRYRWDRREYPYESAVSGPARIVAKKIDDSHYEALVKADGGGAVTITDAISKNGRTRTQNVTGVNAKSETVNNSELFEKQ